MHIEKVRNGYIVTDYYGKMSVYTNLVDVFNSMLLSFEGKARTFGGESFGNVVVIDSPTKEFHELDAA